MKKYILINDSGELVAEEKTMIELDEVIIDQRNKDKEKTSKADDEDDDDDEQDSRLWIAQVIYEVIGVHIEKKRLFNNPASEKEKKN